MITLEIDQAFREAKKLGRVGGQLKNTNFQSVMTADLVKQRQNFQEFMIKTFGKELQTLDSELQSILFDDLLTAFFTRLNVMKKIQDNQRRETNNR